MTISRVVATNRHVAILLLLKLVIERSQWSWQSADALRGLNHERLRLLVPALVIGLLKHLLSRSLDAGDEPEVTGPPRRLRVCARRRRAWP